MRSQDHSKCSSHIVQGELLPKTDDDVDSMLGLAVFYQYIQAAALNQQCPAQYVSCLTTELFAYYLHTKCVSLTVCRQFPQTTSTDGLRRYEICVSDTEQLFIGDVLLLVSLSRLLKHKFYHKPVGQQSLQEKNNGAEHHSSVLVELLHKCAVEHLTTFRQIAARDFGSVATIVTTDFEALYAYKRGDYQRCLQLSTQNVRTLLRATRIPSILTFPEFIQLMDDDIASLIALTLIANPKCRQWNSCYVSITQLTLSLYLMTQCQLKLRHSVMSLAQILDYIEDERRRFAPEPFFIVDRLTFKLIERQILSYMNIQIGQNAV